MNSSKCRLEGKAKSGLRFRPTLIAERDPDTQHQAIHVRQETLGSRRGGLSRLHALLHPHALTVSRSSPRHQCRWQAARRHAWENGWHSSHPIMAGTRPSRRCRSEDQEARQDLHLRSSGTTRTFTDAPHSEHEATPVQKVQSTRTASIPNSF